MAVATFAGIAWLPFTMRNTLASGWVTISPFTTAGAPGDDLWFWVDYDPNQFDGLEVDIDYGDGSGDFGFASGWDVFFSHTYWNPGNYGITATVPALGIQAFANAIVDYLSNQERCAKGLAQCVKCCQNTQGDKKDCHNCSTNCYYNCLAATDCASESCYGCWITT